MDDRTLLELAAKAAGIPIYEWRFDETDDSWHGARADSEEATVYWRPLTDDGDAFRLAVKLRIDLYNYGPPVHDVQHVDAVDMDGARYGSASEELGADPYTATRRAIVRAAAAIGEKANG